MFPAWRNIKDLQTKPDEMGSLSMLLSQNSASTKSGHTDRSSTVHLLEELSSNMIHRINTRDWTHPDFKDILTEDYVAYLEYQEEPVLRGREAYIDGYRAFAEANPSYSIELVSVNADVHEKSGTAGVWMLLKVVGHPSDVLRESVTIAYWRRKGGRWEGYKQTGIRGAGGDL